MNSFFDVKRARWAVLRYDSVLYYDVTPVPLASYAPEDGEILIVKDSPYFGGEPVLLHGSGGLTVERLLERALSQATPAEILRVITEEKESRMREDARLEQMALARGLALVFDSRAALDGWMASGTVAPAPNLAITPADLRIGWECYFIKAGDADLWWSGAAWIEQTVTIDLSGYRQAAEQDKLDALKAPLHSPQFTGVPVVTDPFLTGYAEPLQAAPVQDVMEIRALVLDAQADAGRFMRFADSLKGPGAALRVVDGSRDPKAFRRVDSARIGGT